VTLTDDEIAAIVQFAEQGYWDDASGVPDDLYQEVMTGLRKLVSQVRGRKVKRELLLELAGMDTWQADASKRRSVNSRLVGVRTG